MTSHQHLGKIALMKSQTIDFKKLDIKSDDLTIVGFKYNKSLEKTLTKPTSFLVGVLKRFWKNKWAVGFLFLLILILLLTIIIPLVSPYPSFAPIVSNVTPTFIRSLPPRLIGMDPVHTYEGQISSVLIQALQKYDQSLPDSQKIIVSYQILQGGTSAILTIHPYRIPQLSNVYPVIGTDINGYDMWTKMWAGFASSLGLAVLVSVISIIIGTIYGAIAGTFAGSTVDIVMMRIIDVIGSIPTIVLLIVLSLVLSSSGSAGGSINSDSLAFSLILTNWMSPAYLVRMHIIRTKDAEYVQATRVIGGSRARCIFVHMLPNISGRIFVRFVNTIPAIIFLQASLIFVGLQSADTNTFGQILQDTYDVTNVPQMLYGPVVLFCLFSVSMQIIANAINDAIDPRVVGR
ncbi:MAG: ABC transporter permease [Malacoplasma sp.]|nr:ABC transporter permease [Malacoplasma sp.]MDE6894471.1 ABC transporter permease [Malacoplasma sp.]